MIIDMYQVNMLLKIYINLNTFIFILYTLHLNIPTKAHVHPGTADSRYQIIINRGVHFTVRSVGTWDTGENVSKKGGE